MTNVTTDTERVSGGPDRVLLVDDNPTSSVLALEIGCG